jgi:hypothetical protein
MAAKLADVDEPELEQGTIHPDFETPKNPKIEKFARRYRKLMLARKAAGEEEVVAHAELLDVMIAEGIDHYEYQKLVAHVNAGKKKVKVKIKGADDDAD